MSYEHVFTGTTSANGSSHDSAHQGEDERCPQPFLKRSQAHLPSDGNGTPNIKKQAVVSSSNSSDISSQVVSSSSQPSVMAFPPFLAPPNPFVPLDPAILSIMMSNPAVAMAGYAAMAAAAQNLSHHQQQVAAVLATNAAAASFVRTNSNNTPLNCIPSATTAQATSIPPAANNTSAALPAATIHVTHNNNTGNNHRRSAGSMSIGGGMVSDMSSSTATASSSQAPRRLSDRGYSLATDHSLKSVLSSMASSTADPVPTLPSWGAAWAIPTPNGGTSVKVGSVVPASSSASSPAVLQHLLPSEVEKWKPAKLEKHVAMLQECKCEVPAPLVNLMSEATKRREDKRAAKRVANRKSASISRARKKAFVEEMAKSNERLRRQAMILNLLPDLILAVDDSGVITFCSAQVEKSLGHRNEDLVGESIDSILMPASRETIKRLIKTLLGIDTAKANDETNNVTGENGRTNTGRNNHESNNSQGSPSKKEEGDRSDESSRQSEDLSSNAASNAAVISELSLSNNSKNGCEKPFPLSVVNVKSKVPSCSEHARSSSDKKKKTDEPNGDSGKGSSVTTSLSRSGSSFESRNNSNNPSTSSSDDCGTDERNNSNNPSSTSSDDRCLEDNHPLAEANPLLHFSSERKRKPPKKAAKDRQDSSCIPSSVDNAKSSSKNGEVCISFEDLVKNEDLTKAQDKKVSSGNASLTYESLMKHSSNCNDSNVDSFLSNKGTYKHSSLEDGGNRLTSVEQPDNAAENSCDDSEYGEGSYSFPSRSTENSCGGGRRQIPLAPACNIWLIRNDLTTIWCEVTSSVKRSTCDKSSSECDMDIEMGEPDFKKQSSSMSSLANDTSVKASEEGGEPAKESREFLLCLRPIRDNPEKVEETFRFRSSKNVHTTQMISNDDSSSGGRANQMSNGDSSSGEQTNQISNGDSSSSGERTNQISHGDSSSGEQTNHISNGDSSNRGKTVETTAEDSEISAIKSLILMSSKKRNS